MREPGWRLGPGSAGADDREAGGAADPSLLVLPDGRVRIYYTAVDAAGRRAVASATGADGLLLVRDDGLRLDADTGDGAGAWAPSALRVGPGQVRLYYVTEDDEGREEVRSALSDDGLTFALEEGARLPADHGGAAGVSHPEVQARVGGGVRLYHTTEDGVRVVESDDGLVFSEEAEEVAPGGTAPTAWRRPDGARAVLYADVDGDLRQAVHDTQGEVEVDDVPPEARLDEPGPDDLRGGLWRFFGTVGDDNLEEYVLEVAPSGEPFEVVATGRVPVEDGLLGAADLEGRPSGRWRARLTVVDRAGNRTVREIEVEVRTAAVDAPAIDLPTEPGVPFVTLDPVVAVGGRAEPGTVVEVLVDGVARAEAVADPGGRWVAYDVPLGPGASDVVAVARREALGSEPSAPIEVVRDVVVLSVELDRAAYGYDERVEVTASAETAVAGRRLELTIETPDGERLEHVATWLSDRPERVVAWGTGDTPPCELEAVLRLFPSWSSERPAAEERIRFSVEPSRNLRVEVAADGAAASAGSAVTLRALVRTDPGNAAFTGVEGRLEVAPAGGGVPLAVTPDRFPIGTVPAGSVRRFDARWAAADHPPGLWRATWTVGDAEGATWTASADFEVVSTAVDGAGLLPQSAMLFASTSRSNASLRIRMS